MDADLTPERLKDLVELLDAPWVQKQMTKYGEFRRLHSPDSSWAHRHPSMSPIVPLIYWSSHDPYQPTMEWPMGYWYGEPKTILGRLYANILDFQDYWQALPDSLGRRNISRLLLRTPDRFSGFECEGRTASTYKTSTPYEVEPKFFDPRGTLGEPDIILRKGGKRFNVQCKAVNPSSSSIMSFEVFQYLAGCLGRISQDFDIHSYLDVTLNEPLVQIGPRQVDSIVAFLRGHLQSSSSTGVTSSVSSVRLTFTHLPSKKKVNHMPDQLEMWQNGYLYRERKTVHPAGAPYHRLATVCSVSGVKIPTFQDYIYPKLEESASQSSKEHPLIINVHVYAPVEIHSYTSSPRFQREVVPDISRFFDRHKHVCYVSISSFAQLPVPIGNLREMIKTPAWEMESQHWSEERPDIDPSAPMW